MFARKRAPWRLNSYFCISEYDRKMYLSALCLCVWGAKMWNVKLWNGKKRKRRNESSQTRWKNFLFAFFWKQEYENWELIQFHATIVFVVLRFYQREIAIHIFFLHFARSLFLLWINGWNKYLAGVELICCAIKEMQWNFEDEFTWVILPECSCCQCDVVQAWRIIPIFLALRWKLAARWPIGTCAICFVIARWILLALFIVATAIFLNITSIISIFTARLMLRRRRVVVVVIDGRVVVFWDEEIKGRKLWICDVVHGS